MCRPYNDLRRMVSITVEYLIDHSYTQFPLFAPADYDIVVLEQTKELTADPKSFCWHIATLRCVEHTWLLSAYLEGLTNAQRRRTRRRTSAGFKTGTGKSGTERKRQKTAADSSCRAATLCATLVWAFASGGRPRYLQLLASMHRSLSPAKISICLLID